MAKAPATTISVSQKIANRKRRAHIAIAVREARCAGQQRRFSFSAKAHHTVEQRRWLWSLGFALAWGAVIALVGWFTAPYNRFPTIFEFPFLSGLFAVLLAAPLFQTVRVEGAWRFPYARLHTHAWTDAVIGAASLAFVGITFLLAWLIAGLFDLIGIEVVKDLLKEEWCGWMLAGFAFGAAFGLLRERDALVGTLRRLVIVVLGVLAPATDKARDWDVRGGAAPSATDPRFWSDLGKFTDGTICRRTNRAC